MRKGDWTGDFSIHAYRSAHPAFPPPSSPSPLPPFTTVWGFRDPSLGVTDERGIIDDPAAVLSFKESFFNALSENVKFLIAEFLWNGSFLPKDYHWDVNRENVTLCLEYSKRFVFIQYDSPYKEFTVNSVTSWSRSNLKCASRELATRLLSHKNFMMLGRKIFWRA